MVSGLGSGCLKSKRKEDICSGLDSSLAIDSIFRSVLVLEKAVNLSRHKHSFTNHDQVVYISFLWLKLTGRQVYRR